MFSALDSQARRKAGAHSAAEVASAIESLSPAALRYLVHSAHKVRRRYGLDGVTADHQDLLQETYARLLAGLRSWPRGVDFPKQVTRVMRSIASDWRRRGVKVLEVRETDLVPPEASGMVPLEPIEPAVPERPMEDRLYAALKTQEAAKLFAADPAALRILKCLYLELTRQEMCERTGMSARQVEATLRRIRRRAGADLDR